MTKIIRIIIFALGLSPVFYIGAQETNQFTLHVFFTNDVHGGIVPQSAEFLNPEFPPILGGGASAMSIVKEAREKIKKTGDASFFIDSGDIFQGTLVGTLSEGKAIIEYMNLAGYDACVPGNHDFDLGSDNLVELINLSEFAWVSCNIIDKETGEVWKPLRPYIVKTINGVKIGITGATTVGTEYMSFPENIKGLKFISEIEALRKTVKQLRESEQVDMVVALVHSGLPYDRREGFEELQNTTLEDIEKAGYANAMEMAHFVPGIDLLLGGHLHRGYQEPWVDPVNHTICIQNYGNGGNLGWIKLELDKGTGSVLGYNYPSDQSSLLLLQQDQFWPDSAIAAYISSQQEIYEAGFKEIIGTTQNALTRTGVGEAPMYNLVTDAMRERVEADFSFTNYGGVRADLKAGPITREDIFKVLPFGNQVVRFKASGAFLKRLIERKLRGNGRGLAISGGEIAYNPNRPDGSKITAFTLNGEPLKSDRMYQLATTDYLMEGNSGLGLLLEVPQEAVAYTGILLREAVIEYIKKNSPLNITIKGRWDKDGNAQPDPAWLKQFEEAEQASIED